MALLPKDAGKRRNAKRQLDDGGHRLASVDVEQLARREDRLILANELDDVTARLDSP